MTRLTDDTPPAVITGHSAHPEHELRLVATGGVFRCDGCMQPIDGCSWYRCELCNFDLHTCCARPPETLGHPLFPGRTFVFLQAPPAPATGRQCDACGDDVGAFVYHCRERGLDLHPCCASLKECFVQDGRVFELRKEASRRRCVLCGDKGRRGNFWAYRCCDDDGEAVYLHVACLRDNYRDLSGGGGGGQIVPASSPIMEGVLQRLPRGTRRSGGFERFRKIFSVVVGVIIAVLFGNPMAMIAAVAGPGGLLR